MWLIYWSLKGITVSQTLVLNNTSVYFLQNFISVSYWLVFFQWSVSGISHRATQLTPLVSELDWFRIPDHGQSLRFISSLLFFVSSLPLPLEANECPLCFVPSHSSSPPILEANECPLCYSFPLIFSPSPLDPNDFHRLSLVLKSLRLSMSVSGECNRI